MIDRQIFNDTREADIKSKPKDRTVLSNALISAADANSGRSISSLKILTKRL